DYSDGLGRRARFKRLCTPEALHIVESGQECTLTVEWLYATEPAPDVTTDVAFASLVELGRRGTGQHITPLRVELARLHPKSEVHRAYFGCVVRYGAALDALVLERAERDRASPTYTPAPLGMLAPARSSAIA